jgi:DNA-binding NtrC family response regulator
MDKRILCVDDDAGVRDVIIRAVEAWGYDIQCASGADDAMEMFSAMCPFLVVTDLRLQNHVDGVTLADRLHRQDPLAIFVALSGFVSNFDLGFLLGSVFTDVLSKPMDLDVLKLVIDYAWEKRQRWEKILMK